MSSIWINLILKRVLTVLVSSDENLFQRRGDDQDIFSDLRRELDLGTFSDATLVCQGLEIPVHRYILAARSEYFKTMFLQPGFIEGSLFSSKYSTTDQINGYPLPNQIQWGSEYQTNSVFESSLIVECFLSRYAVEYIHTHIHEHGLNLPISNLVSQRK